MLQKIHAMIRRHGNNKEHGLSITEVLVAATLIMLVFASLGLSILNTFEAQSVNESRNRAVQIAQDRISQAQLVSFPEIGFPKALQETAQAAGGLGGTTDYNGETIYTINTAETAFKVLPYEDVNVGKTDLSVNTYITKVRENTFDGTTKPFNSAMDIPPRRVTVVVNWDTKDGTQSVVRSLIKYPNPIECAPKYALPANAPNVPEGCK